MCIYIITPIYQTFLLTLSMLWLNIMFLYKTSTLSMNIFILLYFNHNLLLHSMWFLSFTIAMILHNTMFLYFYKFKICTRHYSVKNYICCCECTTEIHHYFNYTLPIECKITHLNVTSKSHRTYNLSRQIIKNV